MFNAGIESGEFGQIVQCFIAEGGDDGVEMGFDVDNIDQVTVSIKLCAF